MTATPIADALFVLGFTAVLAAALGPAVPPAAAQEPVNPLAATDPFAGVFEGSGLRLELAPAPEGGYAGRMQFRGETYPARARASGARLDGTFRAPAGEFPFTAAFVGDALELSSGGATYRLARPAAAPAPAPAAPGTIGARPGAGPENDALPQVYRHPIGFTFRYPAGWTVREVPGGLHLVPPDLAQGPSGPLEAYLILGEAAPGIARPDDPRVGQYLDQQLLALLPAVRRAGPPEPVPAGARPGALYTWEGLSPMGVFVRVRSYVTILEGHAVGLSGLGETARIGAREPLLREMFATFDVGAGEVDPRLVGRWHMTSYARAGPTSDPLVSTTVLVMVLEAGGSLRTGGTTASSSSGFGSEVTQENRPGRWGAAGGRLTLIFGNGTSAAYSYHVQGAPGTRELLLTPLAGGEKELWAENPN